MASPKCGTGFADCYASAPLGTLFRMSKSHRRILCIEDDRDCAGLVAEELSDQGYEVEVAHNGLEGIDAIERQWPNLVLCDIHLPYMSGFEVLQHLNVKVPRLAKMHFVFLTALAEPDFKIKGLQLGADGYVTKPINLDMLAANIAACFATEKNTLFAWSECIQMQEGIVREELLSAP